MDPKHYPDKKKLADEIHSLHARLMVSIWPNAMNCPQHADFKQKNLLLHSSAIYDAFNPLARKLYWSYAKNEFLIMVSMLGGVMLLNHWMLTGLIWVIIMEMIVTSVAGS